MATLVGLGKNGEVVQFLRNGYLYGDGTQQVKVIETHMSWVFLTRRVAIKLKKPVKFDFADFSTLEARQRACEEELRLNRRWSSGVYLDVVPVTREAHGELAFDGEGQPLDWVVKMRRLSDDIQLTRWIRQGRSITEGTEQAVARHLTNCLAKCPPSQVSASDYPQRIMAHEQANAADLLQGSRDEQPRVLRIHGALMQFLWLCREEFEQRVSDGRIVDGHGDLRPEHVFLESRPQIIDGLEFSRELRQNDVLDELCFFAMECEKIGAYSLADRVLRTYLAVSNDTCQENLTAFYKAYRAVVRAKVMGLRAKQMGGEMGRPQRREFRHFLALADSYAASLGHAWMIVVGGLMGTGKSTLASALSRATGADLLQTDAIRLETLGRSGAPAEYAKGNYRPDLRHEIYVALIDRAANSIDWGRSVVLDGTFLTASQREQATVVARQRRAPLLFVGCQAPKDVVRRRIAKRSAGGQGLSEGRADLFESQAQEVEEFADSLNVVRVDTTTAIEHQLEKVRRGLRATVHNSNANSHTATA